MGDQKEMQGPVSPTVQPAVPPAAEHFHATVISEIQKPRPESAKLAIARLLNFIVPIVPATTWAKCFKAPDPITAMISHVESPWLLGRISRCLAEINAGPGGKLAMLNEMSWLRNIRVQENGLEFRLFEDMDELIALQLREVLKQKASEQEPFWRDFSKGFSRSLTPRRQDLKALPIYFFFAIKSESIGACSTMRELYEVAAKQLPAEPCPPGVDPVDFEDRRFKWFEKLCQRSLGISFKSRGRPALKRKYPQRA